MSTNNLTSPELPEPDAGLPPPVIKELLDDVRLFLAPATLFSAGQARMRPRRERSLGAP